MTVRETLKKIKTMLPAALGGALVLSAGCLMGYGGFELTKRYVPVIAPITSGTQVAFHQECLKKTKGKDGKEACVQKGPLTIYTLNHVRKLSK